MTFLPRLTDISARTTIAAILVVDLFAGLTWALPAPIRTSSPSYKPAKRIFDVLPGYPARWWGGLLVVLAVAGLISVALSAEAWLRYTLVAIVLYWSGWICLFAYAAATDRRAGFIFIWPALITVIGHMRAAASSDLMTKPARAG